MRIEKSVASLNIASLRALEVDLKPREVTGTVCISCNTVGKSDGGMVVRADTLFTQQLSSGSPGHEELQRGIAAH
jgi:hypothetical protein